MMTAKRLLVIIASCGAAAIFGYGVGAYHENVKWSLRWEQRNVQDSQAAQIAESENRKAEQTWAQSVEQIAKAANEQIEDTRKRERAAADKRVRDTINSYASKASAAACTDPRSAAGAIEVLAGLLDRVHDFAGRAATDAVESRQRGLACEAQYDMTR